MDEPRKDRMHLKAFISVCFAIALSALAAEPFSQGDEVADSDGPRFTSPDGRYAMLVTEDPGGNSGKDRVQLMELSTKRVLTELREPGDEFKFIRDADGEGSYQWCEATNLQQRTTTKTPLY